MSRFEEISMNEVERYSRVRNATILMVLGGLLLIYTGYQFIQIFIVIPYPPNFIHGVLMIIFGILTLCTSLPVWIQKTWAPTAVKGLSILVCGTLVLFGFLIPVAVFALCYWVALDYMKDNRASHVSDFEIPDWAPDWNED